MIIELPLPDMRLSPNRKNGTHWRTTQKHKKAAKQLGYDAALLAAQGEKLQTDIDYKVSINFYIPTKRRVDTDNLLSAQKGVIDGIALALGIDDKQFNPYVLTRIYRKGNGGTVIEIG